MNSSAARLFDGVVYRGMSPDALLPIRDEAAEWEAVALPRSSICRCTLPPGALVVDRALGEGKLASLRVLGEDVHVDELYDADGRVRANILVLAPRARAPRERATVPSIEAGEEDRSFLRWSPAARAEYFPPRDPAAPAGHTFMATIGGEGAPADWPKRESAMVTQLLAGNMPDALLRWVPIRLTHTDRSGTITATIQVLPDYLAVGSDTDYVSVPLDPVSAQLVADRFDCLLPTARICHAIYSHATHKLRALNRDYYNPDSARRIAARGRAQTSTAAYVEHSDAVQAQMRASGLALGELVAGHKKDVVIARRLHTEPQRIAFHGFYDRDGYPFEPCYENREHRPSPTCAKDTPTLAHSRRFADYAQGVRLVHPWMTVGEQRLSVAEVLAHPTLSALLSSEGPIVPPRIPKPVRPASSPNPAEVTAAAEVADVAVVESAEPEQEVTSDVGVAIAPASGLGTSRTTSPIATVSPQRQINELLDRELVLFAQARVVADWFARRVSATFEELLADAALMARLDVSRDGPLLDRIRPFPRRTLPDRRGQLFTTDETLQRLLVPPRDAPGLRPVLDVLHYYGVVLLVPDRRGPSAQPTVMASLTRLTAELTRTRFDTESAQVEIAVVAFKRAVAEQPLLHHLVDREAIPRAWSSAIAGVTLEIAKPLVVLLGRVREGHQAWRAGTYTRHWWNDFSVDIFIAAAVESSGFWARSAVRSFFATLDAACQATTSPGPFAWKAIYNDAGLAREMNDLYGQGRVLSGVDGHGPGPRMHIHLDIRPLVVPFDASTRFRRDVGRLVLPAAPAAAATNTR